MAEDEQEPEAPDSGDGAGSSSGEPSPDDGRGERSSSPDASSDAARGSEARNGRLSALGGLYSGVAALLTVVTTVASTYVAVATYRREDAEQAVAQAEAQAGDARKEQEKASRVTIRENWDKDTLEIENRNLDAVKVDFLKYLYFSAESTGSGTQDVHGGWFVGGALPACTILSMSLSDHVQDAEQRNYTYATTYLRFSVPGGQEHWVALPNKIPVASDRVVIVGGGNPPDWDEELNMRESVTYRAVASRKAQFCK
ncbi:hypothetical protein [Streptomyces sp. NPDC054829]